MIVLISNFWHYCSSLIPSNRTLCLSILISLPTLVLASQTPPLGSPSSMPLHPLWFFAQSSPSSENTQHWFVPLLQFNREKDIIMYFSATRCYIRNANVKKMRTQPSKNVKRSIDKCLLNNELLICFKISCQALITYAFHNHMHNKEWNVTHAYLIQQDFFKTSYVFGIVSHMFLQSFINVFI